MNKLTIDDLRKAGDDYTVWMTMSNHFEYDEVQDFLNRKGYELVIHTAVQDNVNHIRSIPGTGEVESIGHFATEMTYILAIKPGTPLPTRFTPDVVTEMRINSVFQRELRKNLLA